MTGRTLRITHVVGTQNFAGLERYAVEVATAQRAQGHDVEVLGGSPTTMPALLSPSGVRWRPGGTTVQLLRSLGAAGRRDVVHSHITKADFCASATSVVSRGALVSTRHIIAPRGYSRLAKAVAPVVRRRLALEIAVSRWTNDHLERAADEILLNGVRTTAPHRPGAARTVLVAQRLAPEKDTVTGLRAWARSGLADRGWSLVVAGAGPERESLVAEAKDLGLTASVAFPGWVDDMDSAFRSAALLLAPAPTEPCGLTILEAMAMGLPVVASASGGNLETVGSVRGAALFPAGDVESAAAVLVQLAEDDARRSAYGAALRAAQSERFSLEGHVDRLLELYTGTSGRRTRQ